MADLSLLFFLFPVRTEWKKRQLEEEEWWKEGRGRRKRSSLFAALLCRSSPLFACPPTSSSIFAASWYLIPSFSIPSFMEAASQGKYNLLLKQVCVAHTWFTACRKDHKVPCARTLCSLMLQMSSWRSQLPLRFAAHTGFVCSAVASNF